MFVRSSLLSGVTIATLIATAAPSQALDYLHDQRREAGRICMSSHFHTGESDLHRTKAAAQRIAIQRWVEFTAGEYGGAWGSIKLARSRSMECGPSGRGGDTGWFCRVEARPCRRG